MHATTFTATLALATTVAAHSHLWGVRVNGVDQGDGRNTYIRSPPNNSPVKSLTTSDIICNVNGGKPVSGFVKAAAGNKIAFEWYHDNRGDDIIAGSHLGPIITYIAPYTETDGKGAIWTKIAEDGYDGSKWAVEKLINNKGLNEITLPAQLATGKYLIRQEIIAHHESDAQFDQNPARGAQFYPACVQFDVSGSGTVKPTQNFDFNTGYKYSDPGIHFNLYAFKPTDKYIMPGPKVFDFSSGSGSAPAPAPGNGTSPAPTATTRAPAPAPTGSSSVRLTATTRAPAPVPTRGSSVCPTVTTLNTVTGRPTATSGATIPPTPTTTRARGQCKSHRRRRSAKFVVKA